MALAAALAAACAQGPNAPSGGSPREPVALAGLPASFETTQDCCVRITLNLRPDGAYAMRQVLGPSEFYDFGRWQLSGTDGLLFLEGGRDRLADDRRSGRPPKLGADDLAFLDTALQQGPRAYGWPVTAWSIRDLQELLRQRRQVEVSVYTAYRAVRGLGYR